MKIRDVEIKDLKDKVLKLEPKVQDVEKSVTNLGKIIMRIKLVEPDNKLIPREDEAKENSFHIRTEGNGLRLHGGIHC